jgi:hypothetical protein
MKRDAAAALLSASIYAAALQPPSASTLLAPLVLWTPEIERQIKRFFLCNPLLIFLAAVAAAAIPTSVPRQTSRRKLN